MKTTKTKKAPVAAAAKKSSPRKEKEPIKAASEKTASAKAAPVKTAPVKSAPVKAEPKTASEVAPVAAPVKHEPVAVPVKSAPVKTEQKTGVLHEEVAKHAAKSGGARKPLAHGVGRRKKAVARVWLRRGTGAILINGRPHVDYFDTDIMRADAARPFAVVPMASRYDVEANVQGGGHCAQAGAVRLGISRALLTLDESVRLALRENGLLTVDSRVKERKKYGQKAARRKFQFVKR